LTGLDTLPQWLLFAAIYCAPHTEAWLRWGENEESC